MVVCGGEFGKIRALSATTGERIKEATPSDPVEICCLFVDFTSGGPAEDAHRAVLRAAVEAAQQAEPAA